MIMFTLKMICLRNSYGYRAFLPFLTKLSDKILASKTNVENLDDLHLKTFDYFMD